MMQFHLLFLVNGSFMTNPYLSLIFILDNRAFPSFSVHWKISAQMLFLLSVLYSTVNIFGKHVAQNFL